MKKRNIIIISVVVLIGIVTAVVVSRGSRKATFEQNYHVEDIDAVTKIFIADKDNTHVLLQRPAADAPDTTWIIDGQYPANQYLVDLLLETLHDMRIRQQVNKNAVPQIIANISSGSVKVEVYQKKYFINWFGGKFRLFPKEKRVVTYHVGGETQDMMASFMYREGDKVPYIIHIPGFRGYLSPRFFADPIKWRSHKIVDLDIKHIDQISLQIPQMPDESFVVKRNGEGFDLVLANGQTAAMFDTARVAQLLSSFVNLNFDEFAKAVPKVELDTTFARAPRTILRVVDTKGNSHELKTYLKYTNPDDMKAMPDTTMYEIFDLNRLYAVLDSKDTVLIQYYIFDNILQPASFFRGREKSFFAR